MYQTHNATTSSHKSGTIYHTTTLTVTNAHNEVF